MRRRRPSVLTLAAPDDGEPAEAMPAEHGAECVDPTTDRLRRLLLLVAQHKSQAEIAQHFGVSERTIRNWLTEARRRRIAVVRGLDPLDMLAGILWNFSYAKAQLLLTVEQAARDGDLVARVAALRELRALARSEFATLQGLGILDRADALIPGPLDPREEVDREFIRSARAIFDVSIEEIATPDDELDPGEEADRELSRDALPVFNVGTGFGSPPREDIAVPDDDPLF
jgi:transcriptional regulator with XRE-family HTH domain